LNPIYKQKVKDEIDKMLKAGIIEQVEESEWISLMVVQDKKQGRGITKIYVDFPPNTIRDILERINIHNNNIFTEENVMPESLDNMDNFQS
jgi:hypothetical protein